MTLQSAIGILVAVAVPLWLVVEQILRWRALEPRASAALARPETARRPTATSPARRMAATEAALHRKTS